MDGLFRSTVDARRKKRDGDVTEKVRKQDGGVARKTPPGELIRGRGAHLTLSYKTGFATKYGREKGEVMCTVSLPCGSSVEELHGAADFAREFLTERVDDEMNHILDHFWPEIGNAEEEEDNEEERFVREES